MSRIKFIGSDLDRFSTGKRHHVKIGVSLVRERRPFGAILPAYVPRDLDYSVARVSDVNGECVFSAMPRGAVINLQVLDERFAQIGGPERQVQILDEPTMTAAPVTLLAAAEISGKVMIGESGRPAAGGTCFCFSQLQWECRCWISPPRSHSLNHGLPQPGWQHRRTAMAFLRDIRRSRRSI